MKTADDFCPSNDFKSGNPQGKCWGCGHYICKECVFYREDFLRLGQNVQSFEIITLK